MNEVGEGQANVASAPGEVPEKTTDAGFAEIAQHMPVLRELAKRLCRHSADAEDLVQDTIARALEKRQQLRAPECLRSWLVSLMSRKFLDDYRRKKIRRTVDGVDVAAFPEPPATRAPTWSRVSTEELQLAMSRLPDRERECIRRFVYEKQSYKQIAVELGIPEGTVGTLIYRGRVHLRALLADIVGDGE